MAAELGEDSDVELDGDELPKRRLERDLEAENGGAGVYSHDMQSE
jgi:hypothetical protein